MAKDRLDVKGHISRAIYLPIPLSHKLFTGFVRTNGSHSAGLLKG